MTYNLGNFKKEVKESEEWLKQELSTLRTGRATPSLLDGVSLEVYGSMMKLPQVASISVQDARTLYVTPWDMEQVKPIEKAVTQSDLGVSVGADEKGVRVSFPELTSERRQQLIKLLKDKLEDARIALKQKRQDVIDEIEKAGLSEDETRDAKNDVQEVINEGNKALDEIASAKEKELENA